MNGKLNWLKASLVQRGDVLVDEELIAACHQLLSGRTWGIKPLGFLNLCNLCEIVALHERLVVVLPPDYDLTVYGGLWSRLSSAKILWCISAEEISTTYTVEQLEKAANLKTDKFCGMQSNSWHVTDLFETPTEYGLGEFFWRQELPQKEKIPFVGIVNAFVDEFQTLCLRRTPTRTDVALLLENLAARFPDGPGKKYLRRSLLLAALSNIWSITRCSDVVMRPLEAYFDPSPLNLDDNEWTAIRLPSKTASSGIPALLAPYVVDVPSATAKVLFELEDNLHRIPEDRRDAFVQCLLKVRTEYEPIRNAYSVYRENLAAGFPLVARGVDWLDLRRKFVEYLSGTPITSTLPGRVVHSERPTLPFIEDSVTSIPQTVLQDEPRCLRDSLTASDKIQNLGEYLRLLPKAYKSTFVIDEMEEVLPYLYGAEVLRGDMTGQEVGRGSAAEEMKREILRFLDTLGLQAFQQRIDYLPKQDKKIIEIIFATATVTVNGHSFERKEPWIALEYFLWKGEEVHWSEGHLFFPDWLPDGVKNGQQLFRQKMAKCAKGLASKHGLDVKFKGNRKRKAERWSLIAPGITTNITVAKEHYQKATKSFEEWENLAEGPQLRLAKEALAATKTELLKALDAYPNYLEGHVLLARCYENLQAGDIPLQEIESTVRSSWEYLSDKHRTIEALRHLVEAKQEVPLQALLAYVDRHPALSQVGRCEQVLRRWCLPALAQRDPALAELRDLLSQLGATSDESALRELLKRFLRLPCVLEVVKESSAMMEAVSGFQNESGELDIPHVLAVANCRFDTIQEFQAYFRTTLQGMSKGHRAEDRPGRGPEIPDRARRRRKQLLEVEQSLQHELGRKPSEDELKEALKVRLKWGPDDLKEVMLPGRRPPKKPPARPPKGM